VIAFLEGNSKIGLREAVDQVPDCQYQPSVLSSTRKWRRRYIWKCTFMGNCRKFKWSVTLTWIGSRSHQHTQYMQDYMQAQPR